MVFAGKPSLPGYLEIIALWATWPGAALTSDFDVYFLVCFITEAAAEVRITVLHGFLNSWITPIAYINRVCYLNLCISTAFFLSN